ncbi:MAG TPA: ABC transporter substrate-binding protein [Sphingobacteriaceae bacterium]|nr:ABC transporter substrate-binding protein [Sphingobacteriaceae bacterium]
MNKVLAFALALSLLVSGAALAQDGTWGTKGSYVDEIILPIIMDAEAQVLALQRGDIHILPGLALPSHIERLAADPNVDITVDPGYHMFYLAMNMRRPPLNDVVVRRAIAHAIDRDEIILSLFQGYMLPLAEFVPPASPFFNPDTEVPEYDPELAKQILDDAGYRMGPDGIRIDPGTGERLREMTILTPTMEVAPTSAQLGVMVAEAARSIGLPVRAEPLDFNVIVERILTDLGGDRDFDMYALAWGLERFPRHLYTLFHSDFDVDGGDNTPGLRDPDYDAAAEKVWTPRSLEEAMEAAYEAQEILSWLQPYVPLYSRPYMDAFRSDIVTGYVPHLGYGAASTVDESIWTPLNIRLVDRERGGTVRWLLEQEPGNLNILVGSSAYDARIFGLVYGPGLIAAEPVNNEDFPWEAERWEVGTWTTPEGTEGTKVTYYLRKDITWHDGVPFTAHDVKFTMDYLKEQRVPKYQFAWTNYSHAEVVDDYTVAVYFDNVSYWHTYNTRAFLAKHIWENVEQFDEFEPWKEPHPTVPGLTKMIGTGPFVFKEYVVGEYVRVERYDGFWAGLDR